MIKEELQDEKGVISMETKADIGDLVKIISCRQTDKVIGKILAVDRVRVTNGIANTRVRDTDGKIIWLDVRDFELRKPAEFVKAKVGYRILVTEKKFTGTAWMKCYTVVSVEFTGRTRTHIQCNEVNSFIYDNEFEVVEPAGTKTEIGDTVILIYSIYKNKIGERYVVADVTDKSGCVLGCPVSDTDDIDTWISPQNYVVVKRSKSSSSTETCEDCKGTGKIELLTSVVECGCCDERR